MVDVYVKAVRAAPSLDETARQVCEAVDSDNLFTFGELLSEPKVTALRDSPQHAKFYRLLQLFAYGTYNDLVSAQSELPELTEGMSAKLRQLTLVSMCSQCRCIAIEDAMREMHVDNIQQLHYLFITAVYKGILQGRVNSQEGMLEISSWKGRDVTDEQLKETRAKLREWIERCSEVAHNLRNLATQAENAIADAATNDAKVEEEVRRVRTALMEEDEQRGLKDYRRPKSQRSKKHP